MPAKILLLAAVLATACNNDDKATTSTPTEKTTEGEGSHAAEVAELNAQSKQCIRTINSAEQAINVAIASGDKELAAEYQKTMDSAARANVMIGQKLMALEK